MTYRQKLVAVLLFGAIPLIAMCPCTSASDDSDFLSSESMGFESSAVRTIEFSGVEWNVRSGHGGPGPNHWSDAPESVRVDNRGRLRLQLRPIGDTWHGAEVCTDSSGYGTYTFQLATNVEQYDPNVVAGLFTYREGPSEIDIEFSRWGNPDASDTGHYTIWAPETGSEKPVAQTSFQVDLRGTHSTHQFSWTPGRVEAASWHGFYESPPPQAYIYEWSYEGMDVPTAGEDDELCINLWLYDGMAPADGKPAELVISSVDIEPHSEPSGSASVGRR